MKLLRLIALAAAVFASQRSSAFGIDSTPFPSFQPPPDFGRKSGPRGGGCSLTGPHRQFIRTPPPGYWSQVTPLEHRHAAARRRALALA
ncbi:MAG TPA: hypothetical protein VGO11_19740 [Chthoniobacteraceae bacterium]|jgi:hypothetical protein|nr:hypothetical protein [Chthoniobacteraceae bacterium]